MIPVHIRHVDSAKGQHLGDFTPAEIPKLIALFDKYPTFNDQEGRGLEGKRVGLAQFVVDDSEAYFEIIVDGEARTP